MKFLRSLCLVALAFTFIIPPLSASDLSITTANFLPSASIAAKKEIGKAGAAITIGQLLYYDDTAASWKLADANVAAASVCWGIAGSAAAIGQPVIVITEDPDLTLGATLSMTAPIYCLSATAGGIAPVADLTTGWYPNVVLIATSTTKCIFKPKLMRGTAAAQ